MRSRLLMSQLFVSRFSRIRAWLTHPGSASSRRGQARPREQPPPMATSSPRARRTQLAGRAGHSPAQRSSSIGDLDRCPQDERAAVPECVAGGHDTAISHRGHTRAPQRVASGERARDQHAREQCGRGAGIVVCSTTPGLASQDAANACSCGTPSRVAAADGGTIITGTGALAASRNDTEPNRAARSSP